MCGYPAHSGDCLKLGRVHMRNVHKRQRFGTPRVLSGDCSSLRSLVRSRSPRGQGWTKADPPRVAWDRSEHAVINPVRAPYRRGP